MKALDGWMESYGLMGDWSVSGVSPFGDNTAVERTALAGTADPLAGPTLLDDNPPSIVITTTPAALIVTNGAPRERIHPGHVAAYLANGDTKVFPEPTDGEIYAQVGGDWYPRPDDRRSVGFHPEQSTPSRHCQAARALIDDVRRFSAW